MPSVPYTPGPNAPPSFDQEILGGPYVALGEVLGTDAIEYAGGLGAALNTSTYGAATLGNRLNTDPYP